MSEQACDECLRTLRETAEADQWQWLAPETVLALLDATAALKTAERALRDQPMQAFRSDAARQRRAAAIDAARAALARLEET